MGNRDGYIRERSKFNVEDIEKDIKKKKKERKENLEDFSIKYVVVYYTATRV